MDRCVCATLPHRFDCPMAVPSLKDLEIAEGRAQNAKMQRWLNAIKETLRPWWQDDRSNWDGSLCGLPNEVDGVARYIREIEIQRSALLEACKGLVEAADSMLAVVNGGHCRDIIRGALMSGTGEGDYVPMGRLEVARNVIATVEEECS
jgi:hypothetical protein